jgi:hypothetical protein
MCGVPVSPKKTSGKVHVLLRELSSDEASGDEEEEEELDVDPLLPWLREFNLYLNSPTLVPDNMSIIRWWGVRSSYLSELNYHLCSFTWQVNAQQYPVWASLARDHLSIMATSVSSERAFSAAALTITKCHNHLKGDIVEAIQVLRMMYQRDLIFREAPPSSAAELALEELDDGEENGDDSNILLSDESDFKQGVSSSLT